MSSKYKDEGDLFFTFFSYLRKCFEGDSAFGSSGTPKSLDACFDWSTVLIQGNEEVGWLNECVDKSFAVEGDLSSDNRILREDRQWALSNHMRLHPAVTINNMTHTNSTG